jgi:hypothetical protein
MESEPIRSLHQAVESGKSPISKLEIIFRAKSQNSTIALFRGNSTDLIDLAHELIVVVRDPSACHLRVGNEVEI